MKDSKAYMSPRVAEMVRQVRAGSRWERTKVDKQSAIRITGPEGTQTTVLTDDEEFQFLSELGGSIRIKLPK